MKIGSMPALGRRIIIATGIAAVVAVAFSPDGAVVLTGSADRTARLWDVASGEPLGPVLAHRHQVNAVAFAPDGESVLTGSTRRLSRASASTTVRIEWPTAMLEPPLSLMTVAPAVFVSSKACCPIAGV